MPKKKKLHQIRKKKYSCLLDLKGEIETYKEEKVVSFNGFELVTDKRTYGMYDGTLIIEDNH